MMCHDSPAANGASSEARRLHYILVNNVVTFADGNCTNALPDKLLRGAQVAA
jgi:hypothetical protein